MIHDVAHWDEVHKRLHKEKADDGHSKYAEDKEKLFPRNCLAADLGGATGADAIYFLKNGHSVILLDISGFALEVAKKRAEESGFGKNLITRQVEFGMHKLPMKDNSVDVVYSRISLNYFGENHTTNIFSDVYKVLKPGGTAYLTFKSPDDVEEMEYLKDNSVLYEPNVYIQAGQLRSRFTVEQLTQMLNKASILNGTVTPIQEELNLHKPGHHPILYENEVSFTKAQQ